MVLQAHQQLTTITTFVPTLWVDELYWVVQALVENMGA